MDFEYVAVPLVGKTGTWKERHFTYWQDSLLSDGWEEFVRVPWKPIAPAGTGGACVFRREILFDEPRKWTKHELQELIRETPEKKCPQCGKWLDPAMSCCPHCLASTGQS